MQLLSFVQSRADAKTRAEGEILGRAPSTKLFLLVPLRDLLSLIDQFNY